MLITRQKPYIRKSAKLYKRKLKHNKERQYADILYGRIQHVRNR